MPVRPALATCALLLFGCAGKDQPDGKGVETLDPPAQNGGGAGGAGEMPVANHDTLLYDFESAIADVKSAGVTVVTGPGAGEAKVGMGSLHATPAVESVNGWHFRLPVPANTRLCKHAGLKLHFKVETAAPVVMRWIATNASGTMHFQRRFEAQPGAGWVEVEVPFAEWRWDTTFLGDWCEVRWFGLKVEGPVTGVWLDEVRGTEGKRGDESSYPDEAWIQALLLPGAHAWGSANGVSLGIDDPSVQGQLPAALPFFANVAPWMDRIFAEASRPTGGNVPVTLVAFNDRAGTREAFLGQLSKLWNVTVSADGVPDTIQDMATWSWDTRKGFERPELIRELTHGFVSRRLRVSNLKKENIWLVRGIGTYLQVALYPTSSLARQSMYTFVMEFPNGTGLVPLATLFTKVIDTANYAQAALVVGYLIDKDLPLLRALAKGMALGKTTETVLTEAGTSVAALEAAWIAWARVQLAPDHLPVEGAGSFYPVPQEWSP